MQQEQLIRVDTHAALVFELGRREVASAWWMRARDGVTGLEAIRPGGGVLRLELIEQDDEQQSA